MADQTQNRNDNGGPRLTLRERDLAHRWSVSQRTLQRWRKEGYGPTWLTIGGNIRYRLSDVEDFEAAQSSEGQS